MKSETYRFRIGDFECILLNDGTFHYPAEGMVPGVPHDELAPWLDEATPSFIPSPWTCMVVDTGDGRVLIDTGGGPLGTETFSGTGNLQAALASEQIAADEIETVIITHGHPDHAGGAITPEGFSAFSNARYWMSGPEWRFWRSEDVLQKLESGGDHFHEILAAFGRKCLPPIEPQLDLVERDTEIVPGIHVHLAPGHTPGHVIVDIQSGRERLVYWSDTAVHPMFLENPSWHLVADVDGEAASRTRKRVLQMAASEQPLIAAFHFQFPGLGHVRRRGSSYQWHAATP